MESPCINVCVICPDTGLCEGCGRTLEEIVAWSSLAPVERLRIMAELEKRRATALSR